jgi:hypothetical protein
MKCFLWNEQIFFEINKKEEITDNVYLISDYEHDMIKETLDYSGHLWIEDGEIKWSGKRPDEVHIWDNVLHSWAIDDTLFEARLESQQEHIWEKIKSKRLQAITSGVYVESVDKWFHTDEVSVTSYSTIAGMMALNNYEPVQWKVMDNTWVLLTEALFKELQTSMSNKTVTNYMVAEQHKVNMLLLENPLEYDYTANWE